MVGRLAVHTEGLAAEHTLHAITVRNDWLSRAMGEAEEAERAAGIWDTDALRATPLPPPLFVGVVGDHALVFGLSGRRDLNGETGVLLHWKAATGRWAVRLTRAGAEDVLVRPANLCHVAPHKVLHDGDLLTCILKYLPPFSLLRASATAKKWRGLAMADELWLKHRREQRRRVVPWRPLTASLEAECGDVTTFVSWADEYRTATIKEAHVYAVPVWTRGRHGEPDWPAVTCDKAYTPGDEVCVVLFGEGSDDPGHAFYVRPPAAWDEGLLSWRQRNGAALSDVESEGRRLSRNAAVDSLLRALDDGISLHELCLQHLVRT